MDDDRKKNLEGRISELNKEAQGGLIGLLRGLKMAPTFKQSLKFGLGLGAASMVLGAGASVASGLVDAISDPLKRKVGLNRMYRENTFLKDENKKTVSKFYDTLFRFSPTMAMDPVASGSFMKKQLEFQDIGVQPNDLQTIANIESAVRGRARDEIIATSFRPDSIGSGAKSLADLAKGETSGGY